jgi:hypothetical protein
MHRQCHALGEIFINRSIPTGTKQVMTKSKIRYVFLLAAMMTSTAFATEDASWSKPVNGIRARLAVLPSEKPNEPFCRVYLEFQNVSDVAGQIKIPFSPSQLAIIATDKNGKKLAPPTFLPYSALVPSKWQPLFLPLDSTIKFRISYPGLGYKPGEDKVIVDVGPSQAWVIPQDGSAHYLSGEFTIKKEKSDPPRTDWNGTLVLPKVEIPGPNNAEAGK